VLSGRRKDIDLTAYAREPRNGLALGWGFFRRGFPLGHGEYFHGANLYEVPSFGLYLTKPTDAERRAS
jgi:hypothetical protein